jgi:hypothetical protein
MRSDVFPKDLKASEWDSGKEPDAVNFICRDLPIFIIKNDFANEIILLDYSQT